MGIASNLKTLGSLEVFFGLLIAYNIPPSVNVLRTTVLILEIICIKENI